MTPDRIAALLALLLAGLMAATSHARAYAHTPVNGQDREAVDISHKASVDSGETAPQHQTIEVNDIKYHVQIRGKGEPLLLLHGGLGDTRMFGPVLEDLSRHHRVIGVDLPGHGRTALGQHALRYSQIADDMAVIVEKIGHKPLDVMGYSFGGAVALRLSSQHPQLVRKLVIVSAPYARNGWFPEMIPQQASVNASMADEMREMPLYKAYAAVAPRPQDFPKLLDRMGELMRQPYDWAANVRALPMPVMLVYGDSDMVRPEHIVDFYQLLGGGLKDGGWARENVSKSRLAILPGLTHYEIYASPQLSAAVLPFLKPEPRAAR